MGRRCSSGGATLAQRRRGHVDHPPRCALRDDRFGAATRAHAGRKRRNHSASGGRRRRACRAPRTGGVAPGTIASLLYAAQLPQRFLVQPDDSVSRAADDQQRRCTTAGSASPARSGRPPRETTAATSLPGSRRRHQRGAGAGAGAEEAHGAGLDSHGFGVRPARGVVQPVGEERDVEHLRAVALLFRQQEVEQQGREPGGAASARRRAGCAG